MKNLTSHFGFFHNTCTSWEEITVIAESYDRAWELLQENGYDLDEYVIEDMGVVKDELGRPYPETFRVNE